MPILANAQHIVTYIVESGKIDFHSEAPKELISANSTKLKGMFNAENQTFAFKVSMASFQGFNSPLQREHFNENYMETIQYPDATFKGKIIEPIDFSKNGVYEVRAKGRLTVHGITLERIIKSTITVRNDRIELAANFPVKLEDHDIKIPKVVYEKLSPEVSVSVNATLIRQK